MQFKWNDTAGFWGGSLSQSIPGKLAWCPRTVRERCSMPLDSTWQQLPVTSCRRLTAPLSAGASAWGWGASAQLVPVGTAGQQGLQSLPPLCVQQRISCYEAAVAARTAATSQHADERRLSPPDPCAQLPGLGDQSHQTGVVAGVLHMLSWPVSHKHPCKVRPQLGNSPVPLAQRLGNAPC